MSEVVIILGSPADMEWAQRITEALDRFGVGSEIRIGSAHKTPDHVVRLLHEQQDALVFITVAGRSNALSGFVDANVTAPVIACPPASGSFGGMDILSSLRMPSGVAPLVVLEPENAALAAAKMLALARPELRGRVAAAQEAGQERVIEADRRVVQEQVGERVGATS